jgi:hypothetical protein
MKILITTSYFEGELLYTHNTHSIPLTQAIFFEPKTDILKNATKIIRQ